MRRIARATAVLLVVACDAQTPREEDAAPPGAAAPRHHFYVDSSEYTLRRDGEGWTASIGYVFRNPTSDTISVVNCNGAVVMDLQKRVGDAWETAWHGESDGCLTTGLDIAPSDSLLGRIEVWAALPGHANFPTFATAELNGQFRLIWHQPRLDFSIDAENFGDTLTVEQRTTNPFRLARDTT